MGSLRHVGRFSALRRMRLHFDSSLGSGLPHRRPRLVRRSQSLIAKLVTFLSLPAYLFSSVSKSLTHDELLALTGPLVVPFVSVWTCFAISLLIAKVARIERIHHGVFASAFTATNINAADI